MADAPHPRPSLLAVAGRFSATHPWQVVLAWAVAVLLLVGLAQLVGTVKLADADAAVGQSGRAEQAISANFPRHANEYVLIEAPSVPVGSAAFTAAVRDVVAAVTATGAVTDLRSPLDPRFANQVSAGRHAALVQFALRGPTAESAKRVVPVLAATARVAAAHPGFLIAESGDASVNKAVEDTVLKDLRRAEGLSFPITLVILLVAFGAVVAALLPLGLAGVAIVAATALVAFTSHLSGVSQQASSVMLLIGLAVGVDYSMFYLKRQREERAAGRSSLEAIESAAATSGKSVLVSGLTVLVAMSSMFVTGSKIFSAMGQATMLVVAVAVLASLTLLPALLGWLGDGVERWRVPLLHSPSTASARSGVGSAILDRALRRPAVTAALAGAALVVLALPTLRLHTAMPAATDLPQGAPALQTYARVQQLFPGGGAPALVVVQAPDVRAAPVRAALASFERRALATGEMNQPISALYSPTHTAAIVRVPLAGNGEDAVSAHALKTLRDEVIPATLGRVPGVRADVTGMTAATVDFNALMGQRSGLVVGFVLLLAFVLLLVSFRSLVIAATAVVLNLLSVGAAYGVIVALFQWGWGERLLGFTSVHAVASWLPLFLFVVLFGLSMDYHVFILSRVRERYLATGDTADAIGAGIKSTAGVVTAAAVVMVFVFLTFATLSMTSLKEMGVGLSVAVLLDATVVRALLLPATMRLLGRFNWYLPGWLAWLPDPARSRLPAGASR